MVMLETRRQGNLALTLKVLSQLARAKIHREGRASPDFCLTRLPLASIAASFPQHNAMNSLSKVLRTRDICLLESILIAARAPARPQPTPQWRSPKQFIAQCMRRGAKTTTMKRVRDLQQGAIQAEPLAEFEDDQSSQHAQYPPVLQGVRENMIKFPNCVVITRVGNFYEVGNSAVYTCRPC